MSRNLTTLERRARVFLVAPAAIVAGALAGPASAASIVLYAVAAVMLATGAVAYCPLYSVARRAIRRPLLPHRPR
jgi:Inner membrane protein YgaP-like, transmembrane domain